MSEFKLEISTDNAAFCDFDGNPDPATRGTEVARMLRHALVQIDNGQVSGTLRDYLGNTVGTYWFEEGDR